MVPPSLIAVGSPIVARVATGARSAPPWPLWVPYRALKFADIARKTPEGEVDIHSLRVTFATTGLESGIFGPTEMARILGHTTTAMVERNYAKHDLARLRPKLSQLLEERGSETDLAAEAGKRVLRPGGMLADRSQPQADC